MTRGAPAAVQTDLSTQIRDARAQTAIFEEQTLSNIDWRKRQQAGRDRIVLVIAIGFISLGVSLYMSIRRLRVAFPKAFQWYESPLGYLNVQQAPIPEGQYNVSVGSCAVCAVYPPLGALGGKLFLHTPIARPGALFLLLFVGTYGMSNKIAGLQWGGSASQLNFGYWKAFLPKSTAAVYGDGSWNWSYIWASWNMAAEGGKFPANPFATCIWTKAVAFEKAPIIQAYYSNEEGLQQRARMYFTEMFRGGLVGLALNAISREDDPYECLNFIMGTTMSPPKGACSTLDRASSGVQYGTMGMGIAATMLGSVVPEGKELQFLGKMTRASVLLGGGGAALGATVLAGCG